MLKLNGGAVAKALDAVTARGVTAFEVQYGRVPGLAVVLVGDDAASEVYVRRKVVRCAVVGIRSIEHRLSAATTQDELLELIDRLNDDPEVDGILVQLPLPASVAAGVVLDRIAPGKDVDGFHPINFGRLANGSGSLAPCTPLGCMALLDTVIETYRGLDAVVIGRSNIVGKPVAMMLLERGATVTVAHSGTADLPSTVRRADIVVAATGVPELVRGDWVKAGAVVIDVGITRLVSNDGTIRLVGDCAIEEMEHAHAVTPVPGGVGPMTITYLLANTLKAAEAAQNA